MNHCGRQCKGPDCQPASPLTPAVRHITASPAPKEKDQGLASYVLPSLEQCLWSQVISVPLVMVHSASIRWESLPAPGLAHQLRPQQTIPMIREGHRTQVSPMSISPVNFLFFFAIYEKIGFFPQRLLNH